MRHDLFEQIWRIKLPPTDREVLRVLCDHADEQNIAFPSNERIAWFVDISSRTVQRITASLMKAGILESIGRTKGGRGVTMIYKIHLDRGVQRGDCPKWNAINYDRMSPFKAKNHDASDAKHDNLSPFSKINHDMGDAKHDILSPLNGKTTTSATETTTPAVENHDMSGFAYKEGNSYKNSKEELRREDMSSSANSTAPLPSPKKADPVLDKKAEDKPERAGQIREVFAYWQAKLNHPKAVLDEKRKKCIRARLAEGFTVADLKIAIDGCKSSPFHQGANDRHEVYDGIDLIFRDASKVEKFMGRTENGNGNGHTNGVALSPAGKPMLIDPMSLTEKTRNNAYVIQDWVEGK